MSRRCSLLSLHSLDSCARPRSNRGTDAHPWRNAPALSGRDVGASASPLAYDIASKGSAREKQIERAVSSSVRTSIMPHPFRICLRVGLTWPIGIYTRPVTRVRQDVTRRHRVAQIWSRKDKRSHAHHQLGPPVQRHATMARAAHAMHVRGGCRDSSKLCWCSPLSAHCIVCANC